MFRTADFQKHLLGGLAIFGLLLWLTQHPNVREVSALDAIAMVDSGAIVIDVRGRESFNAGHIPGAVSVPLDDLSARIPSLAAAKDRSIVVYCGDGATTGPKGTAILNKAGYPNAVNLKPGMQGWKSAGFPVQKG